MPSFRRWAGIVLSCALVFANTQVLAFAPPPPNAPVLIEHLLRHSQELVTEINLTRGARFIVSPNVFESVLVQPGYGQSIVQSQYVVDRQGPGDYRVGKIANDLSVNVAWLYGSLWNFSQAPNDLRVRAFYQERLAETTFWFHNTMATTYFYIEALRRTYLVGPLMMDCPNRELLITRLVKMEQILFEMRKLMDAIRYDDFFRVYFPAGPAIEASLGRFRIDVRAAGPLPFVPYPYYNAQTYGPRAQLYGPDNIPPVQGNGPSLPAYEPRDWNQRWDGINQGYEDNRPNGGFDPAALNPGVGAGGAPGVGGPGPGMNQGALNPGQGPQQYGPAFGGAQGPQQQGGQPLPGQQGQGQALPPQAGNQALPPQQGGQGYGPQQGGQGFPQQGGPQQQGFGPNGQQQQGQPLPPQGNGRQQRPQAAPGQQQGNPQQQQSGGAVPWGNFDYSQQKRQ